jgi:hypothetical protein
MANAHADGGITHAGAGYYRLDLLDAATASVGKTYVWATVTGCIVIGAVVDCVAYDPTSTVNLGLTALPNVASGSAGAIITSGTGTAQLSVTSGRANADLIYLNNSSAAAANLEKAATTIVRGTCTSGSTTSSIVSSDLSNTVSNDHYKDRWLIFVTGGLAGQGKQITAYTASTRTCTTGTFVGSAPATSDTFVIV